MATIPKIVRKDNPLWPLPPDYDTLTSDGQWQARMDAMRQWYARGPDADPDTMGGIVEFFDYYYLWPDPASDFNSLFYDDDPFPSPPCHRLIMRHWSTSRRSITAAPRGIGKSRLFAKTIMVPLLSYPGYPIVYAGSSEDRANSMGDILRHQLYYNSRIHDDFSRHLDFGGSIKPMRGERATGASHFFLSNGSEIQCSSATSRQRGIRPRRYALDDIEFDLRASSSPEIARRNIEYLIFKVVLPALTRPGVAVQWMGTMLSRQHYIWHAMQTRTGTDGVAKAIDARFDFWARLLIKPIFEDPHTRALISCWPEMWPLTQSERLLRSVDEPRLLEGFSLEEIKASIGPAAWRSEYEQDPSDSEDTFFPFDRTSDVFSYWFSKSPDGAFLSRRYYESQTTIHWVRPDGTMASEPLCEFLRTSRVVCTLDTSYTSGPDSDFKVAAILAYHSSGAFFVLDLWAAQCHETQLTKEALLLCEMWRPASINPEVTSRQVTLYHALEQTIRSRLDPGSSYDYVPSVRPLKVGMVGKAAKISALKPFFENRLFKLPMHQSASHPWRMLIDQIVGFYPIDESNTNLQKDDCLDTVAMALFLFRGRPMPNAINFTTDTNTPLTLLKKGETHDDDGYPLILKTNFSNLSVDDVHEIRAALSATHGISHIPSHQLRTKA